MSGTSVNLLNKTDATGYTTAINLPKTEAHPNLYLKGGEGSTAILDIFTRYSRVKCIKSEESSN